MPNRLQSFPSPALRDRGAGEVSPHRRGEGELLVIKWRHNRNEGSVIHSSLARRR